MKNYTHELYGFEQYLVRFFTIFVFLSELFYILEMHWNLELLV